MTECKPPKPKWKRTSWGKKKRKKKKEKKKGPKSLYIGNSKNNWICENGNYIICKNNQIKISLTKGEAFLENEMLELLTSFLLFERNGHFVFQNA